MNLSQIERKFVCVDFMADYVNYKYNPHIPKIRDLKQHVYKDILYEDAKKDQALYGLAAFQEGDPQEIIQGSQKMSVIGGRSTQKTSSKYRQTGGSGTSSQMNFNTRTNTSNRGTPLHRNRSGVNNVGGRSTIVTDGSYGAAAGSKPTKTMAIVEDGSGHAHSQVALNGDLMMTNAAGGLHIQHQQQQRPFTSKVPQNHKPPSFLMSGNATNRADQQGTAGGGGSRSNSTTQSRWALSKPLRKPLQSAYNSSHLIKRSRLDVSQLPSADKLTASQAISRYYASKMSRLRHLPRSVNDPTVFYSVGDNMKTETEILFEGSPQMPKNFIINGTIIDQNQYNQILFERQAQQKEEEYGNLIKQLYKIKIPDQILNIIRDANPHLTFQEDADVSAEGLMKLMNTEYLSALAATEPSKRDVLGSVITTQKLSMAEISKSQHQNHQQSSMIQVQFKGAESINDQSKEFLALHKRSTIGADLENNDRTVSPELSGNDYQMAHKHNSNIQQKVQTAHEGTPSVRELADQISDYESIEKNEQPVHTLMGQSSLTSQLQIAKNMTELTTPVLTPIEDGKYKVATTVKNNNNTAAQQEFTLSAATHVPAPQLQSNKNSNQPSAMNPLQIKEEKNESKKDSSTGQHTIVVHQNNASHPNLTKNTEMQQTLSNENNTTGHTQDNVTGRGSPTFSQALKTQQELDKQKRNVALSGGKLLFNLKITDLTTPDNPFVFYENQQVDEEGYLLFQSNEKKSGALPANLSQRQRKPQPKASVFKSYNNLQQFNSTKHSMHQIETEMDDQMTLLQPDASQQGVKNSLNASIMLPWLQKPSDLEKRTLKIEVTFKGQLILLRIIHIDKLYPVQYPMIALRIANNMIQNNLLMMKNIRVDGTEYLEKPETRYIKVERNLNQKLTKASSVATYDTQHTHTTYQQLKAQSRTEDPIIQMSSNFASQQFQPPIEVTENASPRDGNDENQNSLERSQVVMKTRNNASIKIQNNSGIADMTSQESASVLIKANLMSTSNQNLTEIQEFNNTLTEKQSIIEAAKAAEYGAQETEEPPKQSHEQMLSNSLENLQRQQRQNQAQAIGGKKDGQSQPQQQKLGIKRVNVIASPEQQIQGEEYPTTCFYRITPYPNDMLQIIEQLQRYQINAMDVSDEIKEKRLLQFPEIMKNLQLIIEFSDCIIQGKDLLNYDVVIDEDKDRTTEAIMKAEALEEGLPNAGRIEGVQINPAKVPQVDGIIKEKLDEGKTGLNAMSNERKHDIKGYIKSKTARYFVLRNTKTTLARINDAQREQQPLNAQRMKSKKDQFNYLHNSRALNTSAIQIKEREAIQVQESTFSTTNGRKSAINQQHRKKSHPKILINQAYENADMGEEKTLPRFNSGSFRSNNSPTVTTPLNNLADHVQRKLKQNARGNLNFIQTNIAREAEQLVSSGDNSGQNSRQPMQNRYSTHRNGIKAKGVRQQSEQMISSKNSNTAHGTRNSDKRLVVDDTTLPMGSKENFFKQSETIAQSMKNLTTAVGNNKNEKDDSETGKVLPPQAVFCKDQIIVKQAKDAGNRTSQAVSHEQSELDKSLERFSMLQTNNNNLTKNSDLDILKDPTIRAQSNNESKIKITKAVKVDNLLAMHEQQQALRQSNDYIRSQQEVKKYLSSKSPTSEAYDDDLISQGVSPQKGLAQGQANSSMADSKLVQNAPIGPIAYLSKYQGHHHQQSSNPNNLSSTEASNWKQQADTNSSANYGLTVNCQVTPVIQQPQADTAAALNQPWGSVNNDSMMQKMPNQSVLQQQHQLYGNVRSISEMTQKPGGKPAHSATRPASQQLAQQARASSQVARVQMLAPVTNYLYRGSNARKTVRDLLDAKQTSDAALLYEAITKKKFDVPMTRQDFSKPGAVQKRQF